MDLFRNPGYLIWMALAAVLAAGLAVWSDRRRRALAGAFAHPELLPRLFPPVRLKGRENPLGDDFFLNAEAMNHDSLTC